MYLPRFLRDTHLATQITAEYSVDGGRLREAVGRGGLDPAALEAAVNHLVQQVPQELVRVLLSCSCLVMTFLV